MNNYSERARFYQYEFNSVEDFGTIEYLIARSGKSIAEIPCGSGRLIYLYEKYPRIIYMVDREPQMISARGRLEELEIT